MSYILNSYIEEVKDTLNTIENILNNNNNNNNDKDNDKISKLFDDLDKDIQLLKLEYNNSNNSKKDINNDPTCKPLFLKYEQLKLQFNKSQLLSNNNVNGNGKTSPRSSNSSINNINNKSNEQRERVANLNKMMENNKSMINQARQDLSNMTNVASDIVTNLALQTEQLKRMEKKFDSIDAHLDNSNKTVDKMSKRWY